MAYIWENSHWPDLHWDESTLTGLLAHVSRELGSTLVARRRTRENAEPT